MKSKDFSGKKYEKNFGGYPKNTDKKNTIKNGEIVNFGGGNGGIDLDDGDVTGTAGWC